MAEDTIYVRGAKPGVVGLWEIDPAHPEGEIFVTDAHAVEAAETAGVLDALASGRIVKSDKSGTKSAKAGKVEQERLDAQKAEQDRIAAEQAQADQAALDKAEADRKAAEEAAAQQAKAEADAAKNKR